jgi:hypothetical protein
MNSKGQKLMSLFLIISLLILPITLIANERRGADLIIKKTNDQQVRGELIAIKENSLLLKEHDSGVDVTAVVNEITTVTIVKKSKAGWGLLGGMAIGGIFGLLKDMSIDGFGGYIIVGAIGGQL